MSHPKNPPSSVPQAKYKRLFEFPVLWKGWEGDSNGWVVERQDGTRVLLLTNHGREYEAKPDAVLERIAEYEPLAML